MHSYSTYCLVLSIQADHNWWSISEQKRDTLPSTQLAISELTFINSRKNCSGDKYFLPRDASWRVVDELTAVLHASYMKNNIFPMVSTVHLLNVIILNLNNKNGGLRLWQYNIVFLYDKIFIKLNTYRICTRFCFTLFDVVIWLCLENSCS